MTELTRRSLLAGTAAAAALPFAGAAPAMAAAPLAGKQGPAFYRYKVGAFECTSLSDGGIVFPFPETLVANAPRDQQIAAGEAGGFPKGMAVFPFNPQLVNTGSKLVLIDTGSGPGATGRGLGRLAANMAAAGVDPKAVDAVIISHLHPDHTQGLRSADGGLAFPNAEVMVPTADWAFWMNAANAEKVPAFMRGAFAAAQASFKGLEDKVTRYEGGKELVTGITAIATPGHTPGHMSFVVASGNSKAMVQSDVTNIPELFLRYPDWKFVWDIDGDLAVQTRKKFHDMAAAERALVVGYHFHFPGMGFVEKSGTGYRLIPAPYIHAI